jgi:hypothetical protein
MKRWLLIAGALLTLGVVVFILTLPATKRRVEREDCSSCMYGILFAARLWSDDNGGRLPSDFLSMTNELSTPRILICRGDHSHRVATSWASFTTNNSSYEIVAPGISKTDTNVVFLRCKFHGYVGYSDGRVLDDSGRVLVRSRL